MVQLADFPWNERMYSNADETLLTKAVAAVENGYANESGGQSRFPGLVTFASFQSQRTYLSTWRGDLIAGTEAGKLYRISRSGAVTDVTGTPVSGGQRMIFSATEDQLAVAAGGPIISLSGATSVELSSQAPESTHVAFLEGYLLAIEAGSERFLFSNPGDFVTWDPQSVFSANSKPSNVTAMAVSPYGELLLAKPDSIEQYELLANGTQPFTRRWSTGEGVAFPYTLVADKTGTYGVNQRFEFVRFYGQISQDQSQDVGLTLEKIDDWTDAWAQEMAIKGQKTIILQAPFATNAYGTQGVTLLLDYRARKWSFLYGWDAKRALPTRFPIWSVQRLWGKMFAGVAGGVAMFDDDAYQLQGQPFPFLIRSAHVGEFGASRIDDVHVRLRRGAGKRSEQGARVALRVNRDNLGFDKWQFERLGKDGDSQMVLHFGGQGAADTWQFEIAVTDDVPVEFVGMKVYVERLRW